MATIGTFRNEIITPTFKSPTVTGPLPGAGDDEIDALGGNDRVQGGGGIDEAKLGTGDDLYVWRSGDGEDVVLGQGGQDRFFMAGAAMMDSFFVGKGPGANALAADSMAGAVSRLAGIETVILKPLGGADEIELDALNGTSIKKVVINLTEPVAQAEADQIEVDGTGARNVVTLTETPSALKVAGLSADVIVTGGQGDMLEIKGFGGNDRIDASLIKSNKLKLNLDGGNGNDVVIGSDRNDVLQGGNNHDLLVGRKGADILDGGSGPDTLKGGAGPDQYWFTSTLGPGEVDTIVGFQVGVDKIMLGSGTFNAIGASLEPAEFHSGATPGAGVYIFHDPTTGLISYDANGDGNVGDAVVFAKVDVGLVLSSTDFDILT